MITTPGCKHNKIWNTCEECRPNLANPSGLFEKLAAIEHERWADWQRYLHSKCVKVIDVEDETGNETLREVNIPVELFKQWERQINTPYSELSEDEKDADRDQVHRYWDLINKAT